MKQKILKAAVQNNNNNSSNWFLIMLVTYGVCSQYKVIKSAETVFGHFVAVNH